MYCPKIGRDLSTHSYRLWRPCLCPMRFGSQEAYQEGESLIILSILHLLLFPLSLVSRPILSVCLSQGLINFETFTNFLQLKPGLPMGGYPIFFQIYISMTPNFFQGAHLKKTTGYRSEH